MIAAIAVVIPARDEQRLIGDCLDSIRRAAQHPAVLALTVTVVVAADSCRDRTVASARRHGAQVLEVECRSAGTARALGAAHALSLVLAGRHGRCPAPPQRLHPHVHGANLGVRADAYLAIGGFRRLVVGEDHALVTALGQARYRVHASVDAPVTTSARRDPRAPGGFGHLLLDLGSRTAQPQD